MRVITISGKAQSGKDTSAGMLREHFEKNGSRVLITHFADLLKYICKTYLGWDGLKDEKGRTLLQRVGTDIFRKNEPGMWVDFMIKILRNLGGYWDWVIIPDTRFPDEVEKIRDAGFSETHIRIERDAGRPELDATQAIHASETALDGYGCDVLVKNTGTLDDLRRMLEAVAEDLEHGTEQAPGIETYECEVETHD